jgi:hypothetical protein
MDGGDEVLTPLRSRTGTGLARVWTAAKTCLDGYSNTHESRTGLLLDVTQDKPGVQHAQRRFVLPIFRFPAYRCLGWVAECQHRYGTHYGRETYHFDTDCTVRLTSLCMHIPSPLAEIPELHRFRYLLR